MLSTALTRAALPIRLLTPRASINLPVGSRSERGLSSSACLRYAAESGSLRSARWLRMCRGATGYCQGSPARSFRNLASLLPSSATMKSDPTTQSNYFEIISEHVALDWHVDLDRKTISGSAVHTLRVREDGVKQATFDTSALTIHGVYVEDKKAEYTLGDRHEVMGQALKVELPSSPKKGSTIVVKVDYTTSNESMALGWLTKEQTQGKQFAYLFSQCQPIYARALLPCQDSPSVKITYDATVTSTLPVLMSAIRQSPPSTGPAHDGKTIGTDPVKYTYSQPVPIPSYLIAIAVGNVRYRAFPAVPGRKWSTGIWAEPEFIDAAYWEFSEDTNRYVQLEEDLVVPYRFGVYDLLVLPPSFPYGGMENACLTFLTPTLLAGDRSLVDVVGHELTHSWFGNGVTHAHASHFWLNEGWTTWMERVLAEKIHGPAERGFSYIIGRKSLRDALASYKDKPKYQRLYIEFETGEDPDDAYSTVPYEKGANFILHLERTLGGLEVFLPYVKDYVSSYQGTSITTEIWREHLYKYFREHGGDEKIKALDSVDWDAWLHGEGLDLPVDMQYDTSLATEAYELADRWDASRDTPVAELPFAAGDVAKLNSNQKIVFVERLQGRPALPLSHVKKLGEVYGLDTTGNVELRFRFFQLALGEPKSEAANHFAKVAVNWVAGTDGSGVIKGRMKFCRPIFKSVSEVDSALAKEVFSKSSSAFHPIARRLIEKDIGLS